MARLWQTFLNTIGSFVLSLLLAVIIWVVAVNTENPLTLERGYPATGLPVSLEQIGPGLVAVDAEMVPRVTVDIRAPRESWLQLEPNDLRVWADLTGLGPGTHQVEVKVDQAPPVDANVRILRRMPDRITITLDETITRTIPVRVEIPDRLSIPSSYQILTPTVIPPEIAVFGPRTVLDALDHAEVSVQLRGSRATIEASRPVQLISSNGDTINPNSVVAMRLVDETVQVRIPVQQRQGYRELIVQPVVVGEPARGYWVSNRSVSPSTVSVVGLPALIESLPSIVSTEPIDISDQRAGTFIRSAPLALPDEVSPVNQRVVSVTIEIEPQLSGKTITLTPEPTGGDPGLEVVKIAPPSVDVLVEGPQVELESLTPEQLVATLDLSGLGVGVHLVAPQIHPPGSLVVPSISPEQIEVTIGEARVERVFTQTVEITGLNPRLRALTSPMTVTVAITGQLLTIEALALSSITPTINVSGLSAGTYVLTPTVALPPSLAVSRFDPPRLAVDLFSPDNTLVVTRTLTWSNLGSGLVLNLRPREVSVLVRGPGQGETLQANPALRVEVDLGGLAAGSYTLQPQVSLPPGYELVRTLPRSVEAQLSNSRD